MQFIDLGAQHSAIAADVQARVNKVLTHQKFIQGPEVRELEHKLAEFCNAGHVITCANGTDALQVALMTLGVGPGSAVFVPSFTYTATAEVIVLLGATPVFVDVEAETFNIDFDSLEQAIQAVKRDAKLTPSALMTVDLFGMPVDYARARSAADAHGLHFISDAAQSFGASYQGRRVGSDLADITTTSFFPAKPLGCYGDGGAIFTDNDEYASVIRSICLHGKGVAKYDVARIGINSRLDTLQAAILLAKMEIFDNELDARNAVARQYCENLPDIMATPMLAGVQDRFAWAQFTLRLDNRDEMQARLTEAGVPSAIYYPLPMHQQPAYEHFEHGPLPVSERLCHEVLSLPMHPYLQSDDIKSICDVLNN